MNAAVGIGIGLTLGGAVSSYTAEVQAWLSRVASNGGTVTTQQVAALDLLVRTYLALGLTDATCRLNAYCGQDLAAALVPVLRGGGPAVDTNVNFVAGDYTPATGLAGDSLTKYINTGVAPSSLGSNGSHHLGVWSLGDGLRTSAIEMGVMEPTDFIGKRSLLSVNHSSILTGADIFTFYGRASAGITVVRGMVLANKVTDAVGGLTVYLNGVLQATAGEATLARPTYPYFVHARASGDVVDAFSLSSRPLGGYTLGAKFDNAQAGTLNTAWTTYQNAMGRSL